MLAALLLTLFACQNEEAQKLLTGKWRGAEWQVAGTPSERDVQSVTFEFGADGSYRAAFGEQEETGTFKVIGEQLYTNAKGQIEKKVKLSKITQDTLVMDMNRAGVEEKLLLVRN